MRAERVLDANGNRAAEGLRVLEDVARMLLADAALSARAKDLRHRLRAALPAPLPADRDIAGDVGTTISHADEGQRGSLVDLIRANASRVAEALRAVEEFAKLAGQAALAQLGEGIRYAGYDLERDLLACLPAHRLWQERLYVLVDTGCTDDPVAVAAAIAGEAGVIQLRAKGLSERAYRDLAARVQDAIAGRSLFVVNDHVAVARVLAADACHVGQDDLSVADVRQVVGAVCAIGMSTHTPQQVAAAQAAGADYIGIGPMFATGTKPHEPVRGPELLAAVGAAITVPSYAIGGIDQERLPELTPILPHGIAVAGTVCRAADPRAVCAQLREALAS